MNKKFSTLMAGLLLASAFTVGNAAEYVKFTEQGTTAAIVKQGAAYQLQSGDKVLALVREGAAYNYSYTLKLVDTEDNANLAETLWKVTYQENKEGGPSFTFVSAAYGIPLSFTPNNDGVNAAFPGTESLWKWLPAVDAATDAVVKNYYKSQMDSVLVLTEDAGKVVAYRQKASDNTGLKFTPVEAASVVLGADDLNSMMMTQALGKFKLTFDGEPKNAENGNIWTAQGLKAVPAIAKSTSAYIPGVAGPDVLYTQDQADAANAAKEAAASINTADHAQSVIEKVTVVELVNGFKADVKAAATGADFAAAKEAATALMTAMTNQIKEKDALHAAAAKLATKFGGTFGDAVTPRGNEKSVLSAVIVADVNRDIKDALGLNALTAALIEAFSADAILGTPDAYNTELTATEAVDRAKALATSLKTTQRVTAAMLTSATDKTSVWPIVKSFYAEAAAGEIAKLVVNSLNFSNADLINSNIVALESVVDQIVADMEAAVDGMTFAKDALDVDQYQAALTDPRTLATLVADGFTVEDITTVANAVNAKISENSALITNVAACKTQLATTVATYEPEENATEKTNAIAAITEALNKVSAKTVLTAAKKAAKGNGSSWTTSVGKDIANTEIQNAYDKAEPATVADAVAAIESVSFNAGDVRKEGSAADEETENAKFAKEYVSLSLDKTKKVGNVEKDLYLAVDTNFVTSASGRRHLKFAEWYYAMPKRSDKADMPTDMQRDYNGHFNFKFTYYPTQDSLDIETDGYAMKPAAGDVKHWVDIENPAKTYGYEGNGKTVMLAVLADNHSEVTVGTPQVIAGSDNEKTINTRIGFNACVAQATKIDAGVYTIQFVSNDEQKKDINGRYVVTNWLGTPQTLAKVEDQDLNHIPAAQWMLSHENGSAVNTIVNRESGENLAYVYDNTATLPISLLYGTDTEGLYTTIYGDSLKLAKVDAAALKDSKLGYYRAATNDAATGDQLEVYRLQYLSNLANVFVDFSEADSILNVSSVSEENAPKFRLIPAESAQKYGASNTDLAVDLYRQAYYIQYETGKANVKDEDKLYVTSNSDGKYRLNTTAEAPRQAFFLKEFKEADGAHSYALVETYDGKNIAGHKVSVKDYPSILVQESLEGELQNNEYFEATSTSAGWYSYNGRTSTFLLTEIDAPMYRRLGVTDENDGLIDKGTNNAKIFSTRNTNRYLYENKENKVAGYEKDPLGLNFLGDINVKEADKNLSIFVDTAYVRNNTARPQYMLAMRPDFTPDTIPCEAHPGSHPYDLVDAIHADYLVALTDSAAAYTKKTTKDKFLFDGYTRLAFVPAKHIGDKLIITNSVFTGDNAGKNTIDLSTNAFREGAWQFRLTGNDDAEFYIEGGANGGEYIRLINGVAVLTDDIQDAERFNIEKTDENATANESIAAEGVQVIAGKGVVTVQGAAGKVVTVANILGQTIANQVATSDNVTIAVPAGIVVVSVDGDATKVVVK